MNGSVRKEELPRAIRSRLDAVRSLLRRYLLVRGVLLIGCWLLLVFWLAAAIDYLPVRGGASESPRWLRGGVLVLMVVGSLWIAVRRIGLPCWRHIPDSSIALLIERHYPRFGNALVTTVELTDRAPKRGDRRQAERPAAADRALGKSGGPGAGGHFEVSNPAAHHAMLARVREVVEQRIEVVSPRELFNWQPMWAAASGFAIAMLLTGVVGLGATDWFGHWSKRLFALSDVPWPRSAVLRAVGVQFQLPAFTGQLAAQRTMLPFEEGLVRVPAGSAVRLQIGASTEAPRVPEACTLFYRSEDGAAGRANLRRVGGPREGWQQFTLDGPPLDGVSSDLRLDVVGLDARLRNLQLNAVQPAIVTGMQLDCVYPEYLQNTFSSRAGRERLAYRAGIRIPEGTQVSLIGTSSEPLTRVDYLLRGDRTATDQDAVAQPSNARFSDLDQRDVNIQQLQVDGREFRLELGVLSANAEIEVRLIDQYGLPSDQVFRYVVASLGDSEPEVDSRLHGIGMAVTPNAKLPIRGAISDDYGVAAAYALLGVDDGEPLSIPLELDDDGNLASDIDLQQLREEGLGLESESTLGLVVEAEDFYDLDEQPHVGRGAPQQLAIVTVDQLLVILDRRELELRQRFEVIMAELIQLQAGLEGLAESLQAASGQSAFRNIFRKAGALVDSGSHAVGRTSQSVVHAGERAVGRTSQSVHHLKEGSESLVHGSLGAGGQLPSGRLVAWQEDPTDATSQDQADEKDEESEQRERRQQRRRMAVLRAQQSQLQGDKSEQELLGIANRVEDIRLQLINNRIDSYDRQERLLEKVHRPLTTTMENEYQSLNRRLAELQTATMSDGGLEQCKAALDALAEVLDRLEAIKANMLDIESFNEIVDLVRSLADDQQRLLEETEKQQRARVLDLLN